MYNLRVHGFLGSQLPRDLTFTKNDLPTWKNLGPVKRRLNGLNATEHLLKPIEISGVSVIPRYEWGKKLDEGTYGKVFKAKRMLYNHNDVSGNYIAEHSTEKDIVIKQSPVYLSDYEKTLPIEKREKAIQEDIAAHIHEATVMCLAYLAVKETPFSYALPEIFEVFLHSKIPLLGFTDISAVCIAMEYIHGNTLHHYLYNKFSKYSNYDKNDEIFLNFLEQVANIIKILQEKLRMNHRDMKINNILLRNPQDVEPKLVLIDYGFACIANNEEDPREEYSKVEAGSYFGSKYACFKQGRDICQFIYSVHSHFPLNKYLTDELYNIISDLMSVEYSEGVANLMNGLSSDGRPLTKRASTIEFDENIYLFLRRPEVDPLSCSPENVLKVISEFRNNKRSQV